MCALAFEFSFVREKNSKKKLRYFLRGRVNSLEFNDCHLAMVGDSSGIGSTCQEGKELQFHVM